MTKLLYSESRVGHTFYDFSPLFIPGKGKQDPLRHSDGGGVSFKLLIQRISSVCL